MTRQDKLEELQNQAVADWLEAGGKGTVVAATGFGKSFVAFKAVLALLKAGLINEGDRVMLMAETDVREATFAEEAMKFRAIYGVDPMRLLSWDFACYQAKTSGEQFEVLIADEIHSALSPKYAYNFINNTFDHILGLTATTQSSLQVYRDDETNDLRKGEILKAVAPVVFEYNLARAVSEGILSPYRTIVINHSLDTQAPVITDMKKGTVMTEHRAWGYAQWMRSNWNIPKFVRANTAKKASRMLWNLPSKQPVLRAIMAADPSKMIIFSNELKTLEDLDIPTVSGKLSKTRTAELIGDFNNGKITRIGSARKLKQGITLNGVEACVLASYYSGSHHVLQQLGRVIRYTEDKVATLYIIRTRGTFEERWFDEMRVVRNEKNQVADKISLNVAEEVDSVDFINRHLTTT